MRYIEAKVNGKPVRLYLLKETPQGDGTIKVLITPPDGSGARSVFVDPENIKEDES